MTECFARASNHRPPFEEDALLQFASRLPGLPQDSFHGASMIDTSDHGAGIMEYRARALTNMAISDAVQPCQEIVTRRFSIGLSGLSAHNVSRSMFDEAILNDKVQSMRHYFDVECQKELEVRVGTEKRKQDFDLKSSLSKMKVSTNFFDDVCPPAVRRSSIDSVESFATESVSDDDMASVECDDQHHNPYVDAYSYYQDSNEEQERPAKVARRISQIQVPPPKSVSFSLVPSSEIKGAIEAFTSSMTKSIESQQAIHDWDRKMGLKRSHSKTMRLSMRSRKRLKIMLKKELVKSLKSK